MRCLTLTALVACTPVTPWLVTRHCTHPYEIAEFTVTRCSDIDMPYAACLYEHKEEGIDCVEQLERATCDGEWDEAAHYCGIYSPSAPEDWEAPLP